MSKSLLSAAVFIVACTLVQGQGVKVGTHGGASDVWGRYYQSGLKLTFCGRVTGIAKTLPAGEKTTR